jgi:hypothetical protein
MLFDIPDMLPRWYQDRSFDLCYSLSMIGPAKRQALIRDIAKRALTVKQLAIRYKLDPTDVRDFAQEHLEEIKEENQRQLAEEERKLLSQLNRITRLAALENLTDTEEEEDRKTISSLWVSSKYERLKRYQFVLEHMLLNFSLDPVLIREIRSYLNDVAEELGQLPNRGTASDNEESVVKYTLEGVNLEDLQ